MLNLKNLFCKKKFKIQTFTYFIPAAKQFQKGYREKQFDQLFYEFINKGFEILDFKAQSLNGTESSGIWLIFIVRATNKSAEDFNINFPESFLESKGPKLSSEGEIELPKDDKSNSKVEGIYYIEDK